MSWSHETTIWCDGCVAWDRRSCGIVARVRRKLKREGWTSRRVDGVLKDYCPACSKTETLDAMEDQCP